MAGAANTERIDAYVLESTPGTTPATPAFTKMSFDTLNMKAAPRISEAFASSARGSRSAVGRNGITVNGSAAGKLVYGEFDWLFESLFQAAFSSDILVDARGQRSYTIEQSAPQGAGSGTRNYTRFRGVEAVTGQISLTAGQDATLNFDLIGSGSDNAASTAIAGSTYGNPTHTRILGSGADIGTITMSGLGTLDCMSECQIDFGVADKTEQPRLSSDDPCGINRGAMRPIITGKFYMEDNFIAIYNAARAGTEFVLTIPVGSVTGEKYEFYFPKCVFAEAPMETAESGPLYQTFRILSIYDNGISGSCRLTRDIA